MKKTSSEFKIGFLGDIHIGTDHPELAPELKKILQDCNVVIANLESPICEPSPIEVPIIIPSTKEKKTILLRSELGSERILTDLNIRYVTVANNHIFDQGEAGFASTCRRLEEQGIKFVGAGNTAEKTKIPIILDTEFGKIGVISATEERAQSFIATENSFGCNTLAQDEIVRQIKQLKSQVKHVIVSAHWGYCGPEYPPMDVLTLGEKCIDEGAALVVGHHSHVVHGYNDLGDGKLIAYSLGNFYFAPYEYNGKEYRAEGECQLGAILTATFSSSNDVAYEWHFTRQHGTELFLDHDKARTKILQKRSVPLLNAKRYAQFAKVVSARMFLYRVFKWMNPLHWRSFSFASIRNATSLILEMFVGKKEMKGSK